jgi:parallel beta-helix repeat protein
MPKQVNLSPNLRIDIADLTQQTVGLSIDGQKHLVERTILDNKPVVFDGFRVQVTNAATKWITVYNGVAFDRDGQILNNEEDFAAKRDITFTSNNTYYVEVIYTQTASDSDSRGFWDPTYSNGSDPSGDTRPKGREVTDNVSTRITPDWQIVNPISTSGFELDTNPNSVKIPVAKVVVSGGVITGTTHAISSVLLQEVTPSSSKVYVTNSRELPIDSFSLVLSPGTGLAETVTITTNDPENGVLTLGSSPGNTHPIGSRCSVTGSVFLTTQGTGSLDRRTHYFSGDENTGYLLGLDPNNVGDTRTDTELKSLKNYIDHLSSQIRELKFGAAQTTALGNTAPPLGPFTTNNRYYSPSCGVVPTRTATVTVGDGVNSFGDFNANVVSADAALDAAISYINTRGGGHLHIKAGTYDISASKGTLLYDTIITGDGKELTKVYITNSAAKITNSASLTLQNLSWYPNGTDILNDCFSSAGAFFAKNCKIGGISGDLYYGGRLEDVTFLSTTKPINVTYLNDFVFDKVSFVQLGTIGATDYIIKATKASNVTIKSCNFYTVGTPDYFCYFNSSSTDSWCNLVVIENTNFNPGGVVSLGLNKPTNCRVENNTFNINADCTAISTLGATQAENVKISKNNIQCSGSGTTTTGISLSDCYSCVVDSNTIESCDFGIKIVSSFTKGTINGNMVYSVKNTGISIDTIDNSSISDNNIKGTTSLTVDAFGIKIISSCDSTVISNNKIYTFTTSSNYVRGICIIGATTITNSSIINNTIKSLQASTYAAGITIVDATGVFVNNNQITTITPSALGSDTQCYGIYVVGATKTDIAGNCLSNLGNVGLTTTDSVLSGIYLSGTLTYVSQCGNKILDLGSVATRAKSYSISTTLDSSSSYIKINDNQINGITTYSGIHTTSIRVATPSDTQQFIDICKNIILGNTLNQAIELTNTAGTFLNVTVDGNIINGGIVGIGASCGYNLGNILITNNNVSLSTALSLGVSVIGNASSISVNPQTIIKGNFVIALHYGISVTNASSLISENSVMVSGNNALDACIRTSTRFFNINGNTATYDGYSNTTSCCIDTSGVPSLSSYTISGSIVGNTCYYGLSATGSDRVYSNGIRLPSTEGDAHAVAVANVISRPTGAAYSLGDGFAIEQNGLVATSAYTKGSTNTDSGATPTACTTYTDVGLNIRLREHA